MKLWKVVVLVLVGVMSAVVVLRAIEVAEARLRDRIADNQAL